MTRPDRDIFYPVIGQTKWSRLKKALLIWDPLTRFVKKVGNVPVIGKRVTWFWDEDHFNQTVIPINRELADGGARRSCPSPSSRR